MQLDGRSGRVRASLAVILSVGVLTSLWAWQRLAAGEGVSGEVDVTDQVSIKSDEAPLRASRDRYYVRATVTNVSEKALAGPLALVIDKTGIEDFPVANSDGFLASGKPYLWLVAEGASLEAGAKTAEIQVKFASEGRLRFGQRREFELSTRVVQISAASIRDRNQQVADASPRPMSPGTGTASGNSSSRGTGKSDTPGSASGSEKPAAEESGKEDPTDEKPTDEKPASGTPGREGKGRSPYPDEKEVARVIEIQDKHNAELMKIPGVTGVATSADRDGNVHILAFVERAGIRKDLPATIEGVDVETRTISSFRAQWVPPQDKIGTAGTPPPSPTLVPGDVQVRFARPTPIGVSSLTSLMPGFVGTLGSRVVDLNGNVYGLSNFHVWADAPPVGTTPGSAIGDSLLQPSPGDGGVDPADSIGTLAAFVPLSFTGLNQVDAAMCSTTTAIMSNSTAPNTTGDGGSYTPSSTSCNAVIGLKVKKVGRTTGITTGQVIAVNATLTVGGYSGGSAAFENQIIVAGTAGAAFSAGGDSGSLTVSLDSNQPVGLLFAGGGGLTILNPIDVVLQQLGASMGISGLKIDGPPAN